MSKRREEVRQSAILVILKCDIVRLGNPIEIIETKFDKILKTDKNYSIVKNENNYYCRVGEPYYVGRNYAFIINEKYLDKAKQELVDNKLYELNEEKKRHLKIIDYIEKDIKSIS